MLRATRSARGADLLYPKDGTPAAKARYYGRAGWEACRHMYHGSRLLWHNSKIAARLGMRVRSGQSLSRRERMLLERATVDLLRLVPFSLFIVVPAGELLLPVALKMFPDLVPSTFETAAQGKQRAFAQEMVKAGARSKLLEYSTMQIVSASHGHHHAEVHAILRRMASGDKVAEEHLARLRPMFLTGGPLGYDRLPPNIVVALARVCGKHKWYHAYGPQAYVVPSLRSGIEGHFTKLRADDKALAEEGLSMLTRDELEHANHARGMRWVDEDAALVSQLQTWLDASEDERTPYHMLFFVRPTYQSLGQSMRKLPADTREKLLGIMRDGLPVHVADNLDVLCDNIAHPHQGRELEEGATADDLADKVASGGADAGRVAADLANQDAQAAVRAFLLSPEGADVEALYDAIVAEDGQVTVSAATDFVAQRAHLSTHVVSTLFDAMDYADGRKVLSRKKFAALLARLKAAE